MQTEYLFSLFFNKNNVYSVHNLIQTIIKGVALQCVQSLVY